MSTEDFPRVEKEMRKIINEDSESNKTLKNKKHVNDSFVYVKYLKSQTFVKNNDSAKISVPIVIPRILCDVYVLKNKMHFKL
jgi:threonyl-tRNA synthetase